MKVPSTRKQALSIFLAFFVAVGVGFFVPISRDSWFGIVWKSALFVLVFAGLYSVFFIFRTEERSGSETGLSRKSVDWLSQGEPDTEESAWNGFGNAFQYFAQDLVSFVRGALVASCAGIYLKKGKDILEFHVGEIPEGILDRGSRIPPDDYVQRVFHQNEAVLESNLPVGTSMGGMSGVEIRSFLGVPLSSEQATAGVLAVGGEGAECFGEEDRDMLYRAGDLLIRVMDLCHRGIKWEMDQAVYRTHISLEKALERARDEESAVYGFIQHVQRVFPFDRISLSVRERDEGIVRYVYGQGDIGDQGMRFALNEGLNGWVLKRNTPLLVGDMEEGNYIRPRYSRDEDLRHGLRSFLGIPLGSGEGAWGCISLESRSVDQYGIKERDVLQILAVPFQIAMARFQLIQQLKEMEQEPPAET